MASRLNRIDEWETLAKTAGYEVSELARLAGVTPRQVERFFETQFQLSPRQWLGRLKMKQAAHSILQGVPPKEISATLGYKDYSHFCRAFKKIAGCSPGAFTARASGKTHDVAKWL